MDVLSQVACISAPLLVQPEPLPVQPEPLSVQPVLLPVQPRGVTSHDHGLGLGSSQFFFF